MSDEIKKYVSGTGATFAREAGAASLAKATKSLGRGNTEVAAQHVDDALRRLGEMLAQRYPERVGELNLPGPKSSIIEFRLPTEDVG